MKTEALPIALPDKSTNVRSLMELDLRRTAFQFLSVLAPGTAARIASKLFLTPPPPRPLSSKARALYDAAADRFNVKLVTDLGGREETSPVSVALWGRGPAVYLLHGWGGRGAQWVSFVEPLVQAGFTAVTLDAPLHGDSPAPRTSILHFAAALAAVVDNVGPARALIGHSLGGAASSLALKRGLTADRAVLIGAPADPAEFFTLFLGHLGIPPRLHGAIRHDVERAYGFAWSDLRVGGADLKQVSALVLHDVDDREVEYADAARIAEAWPGAELVTTRGLGHQRILRDRDTVGRVVSWLSDA